MEKNRARLIVVCLVFVTLLLSGCAAWDGIFNNLQGSLVGDDYKLLSYDDAGNNTLTAQGRNISIGLFSNFANRNPDLGGFKSEVLEITVEGKQLLHVGSSMIFAESGIDMIEDFDIEYLKNATTTGSGGLVAIDRTINAFANQIGKKKTIIVRSQSGIVIGVYQGNSVLVEIPSNLPKMTRLVVDGKSLYIYRSDYDIFDTGLFK